MDVGESTIRGITLHRNELDRIAESLEGLFWMVPLSRSALTPTLTWILLLRDLLGPDWSSITILVNRGVDGGDVGHTPGDPSTPHL